MSDLGKIIVWSAGFSALFSGAIIWLFKSWISERLKNAIAHEYAQKLETHKAELAKSNELFLTQFKNQLEQTAASIELKNSHDKKLFEKLNSILDEKHFLSICKQIRDHSSYSLEESEKMFELRRFGDQIENQFLNGQLQVQFSEFHEGLDTYLNTVSRVFFNTGDKHYVLYPELKYSDDEDHRNTYYGAQEEVLNASDTIIDLYCSFRKNVKDILYI